MVPSRRRLIRAVAGRCDVHAADLGGRDRALVRSLRRPSAAADTRNSCQELHACETLYLRALDFRLTVSGADFVRWRDLFTAPVRPPTPPSPQAPFGYACPDAFTPVTPMLPPLFGPSLATAYPTPSASPVDGPLAYSAVVPAPRSAPVLFGRKRSHDEVEPSNAVDALERRIRPRPSRCIAPPTEATFAFAPPPSATPWCSPVAHPSFGPAFAPW